MAHCYSGPPKLPVFNITCNIWFGTQAIIPIIPPTAPLVPCQLCAGEFVWSIAATAASEMYLKLGKLANIHYARTTPPFLGQDLVEVPAASGRYYYVYCVDDVGKGFANEYRFARIRSVFLIPDPLT